MYEKRQWPRGCTMSRIGLLTLIAMLAACGTDPRRSDPTAPNALAVHASAAPTAEGCLLDPSECPPDAWVFSPAELDNFPHDASNCDFTMFGLAPTIPQWDFHPTAACRERQWGQSGIYRQQARDIHVTSLPKLCGGPGDIDEIRLCSLAWVNRPTPYGFAAGAGGIVVQLEVTCGV
jgi:hypothetical protein